MKIAAIVTARNKSSRLPNKHLLKIGGEHIIEILLKRLINNQKKYSIILATTTDESDDPLEEIAKKLNIICYRGYKLNVKGRVFNAAKNNNVDHIIKVWGDSPLIDCNIINEELKKYLVEMPDVLTTKNKVQRLPEGMDFQIYSTKALKKSLKFSKKFSDFEHVGKIFFDNQKEFKIIEYIPPKNLFFPEAALLLDEHTDYILIKKLLEKSMTLGKNFYINCEEIIQLLKQNPKIKKINTKIERTKN